MNSIIYYYNEENKYCYHYPMAQGGIQGHYRFDISMLKTLIEWAMFGIVYTMPYIKFPIKIA